MRQNQSRVDSKRAEHLFCLDVVEVIETTLERLTIERHNMRAGTGPGMVQVGRMLTKDIFNIRRAQPLQNIPDGGMSGWPFPSDLKGSVQLWPMDLDESSFHRHFGFAPITDITGRAFDSQLDPLPAADASTH